MFESSGQGDSKDPEGNWIGRGVQSADATVIHYTDVPPVAQAKSAARLFLRLQCTQTVDSLSCRETERGKKNFRNDVLVV